MPREELAPLTQLPPHRILVVNDYEPHAKELATQLRKAGHTVEIAYDGQSALELERTFRPQMVMIELALKGVDAFAVARSLRAQANRDLILASTALGVFEDWDRADREDCFDDHMNKDRGKPFLMKRRKKLADISPEDWIVDQRMLSRDDFTIEVLLAVTARRFRPQFSPDELAPLIPDEVLRDIQWLTESPTNLADYVANNYQAPSSGSVDSGEPALRRISLTTFTDEEISEGVSRWFRFFNP